MHFEIFNVNQQWEECPSGCINVEMAIKTIVQIGKLGTWFLPLPLWGSVRGVERGSKRGIEKGSRRGITV